MDLVNTARIVRRRWYMALIGMLATLGGAALVLTMPPTYEATSVLVLLAPNTPPAVAPASGIEPRPVNPYQAFDSSITITAELMSTQLTQPEVVEALVRRGAVPDYTVATDPETGGPTVTITAKAPTPGQALATTRIVSDEFRRQLVRRQTDAGAPDDSVITASPVVTPTHANKLVSGRVRALIAVGAVGTVGSIGLALTAETIALARQRRHDRQPRPGSTSTPGTGTSGDPADEPAGVAGAAPRREAVHAFTASPWR